MSDVGPLTPEERFFDFDEAWSEKTNAPIELQLLGQRWTLPGVMPAAAPLKVARLMADGREAATDLTHAELLDIATGLIPLGTLNQWLNLGLDIEKLGEVIVWLIGQYGGPGGDAPGEVVAPETGAQGSSSPGGGSSKPTSPASTDSTSQAP